MRGRGSADEPGGRSGPDEPAPAELWVTGASSESGPVDAPPPGGPRRGGSANCTRWIALAAGFAVLVAVIAVQHFAGGHPAATPVTGSSSAASAPPSSAPTGASSTAATTSTPTTGAAATASAVSSGAVTATESPGGSTSTAPSPTAPRTTTAAAQPESLGGNWQLVGYGTDGLVRYWPATKKLVVTPVPDAVGTDSIVDMVATASTAVLLSPGASAGYVVPAGKPATALTGLVLQGQTAIPGPDPHHVWITTYDGRSAGAFVLVDARGRPTKESMPFPASIGGRYGFLATPDGAGYALINGIGGTYDLRPNGATLVTHGTVLAVGPTAFLVYECDAKALCSSAVIDRPTGKRTPGPKVSPDELGMIQGTISPDGRYAALLSIADAGPGIALIDLTTGTVREVPLDLGSLSLPGDSSTMLAFTPDSRYLFVASGSGTVRPVDTRTGKALAPLDLPPMNAIAVLPTS